MPHFPWPPCGAERSSARRRHLWDGDRSPEENARRLLADRNEHTLLGKVRRAVKLLRSIDSTMEAVSLSNFGAFEDEESFRRLFTEICAQGLEATLKALPQIHRYLDETIKHLERERRMRQRQAARF